MPNNTLTLDQKVALIQEMKKDIAAGAFSSEQQVGIMNNSSRLQVGLVSFSQYLHAVLDSS